MGIHWDWNQLLFKMRKYWRFFLFFKFYKNLNKHPDSVLILSDTNFVHPVRESFRLEIPITAVLDVNYRLFNYISYPLLGNAGSVFIHIFYFFVLMRSFESGKKNSFENFTKIE
jgi:ribosomal protein S2